MKTSFLFLAEGFDEIEAVAVWDILRRAGVEVKSVSMTGEKTVVGAHNVAVVSDVLYESVKSDDVEGFYILPGSIEGTKNLFMNDDFKMNLLNHYNQGRYVGAIGEAPSILGELDMLNGKNATAQPAYMNFLQGATYTGLPVEIQDNVITGRGAGDSFKFAIGIVSMLKGKDAADKVSKELLLIMG